MRFLYKNCDCSILLRQTKDKRSKTFDVLPFLAYTSCLDWSVTWWNVTAVSSVGIMDSSNKSLGALSKAGIVHSNAVVALRNNKGFA